MQTEDYTLIQQKNLLDSQKGCFNNIWIGSYLRGVSVFNDRSDDCCMTQQAVIITGLVNHLFDTFDR